jgi:hypothetical protein
VGATNGCVAEEGVAMWGCAMATLTRAQLMAQPAAQRTASREMTELT